MHFEGTHVEETRVEKGYTSWYFPLLQEWASVLTVWGCGVLCAYVMHM